MPRARRRLARLLQRLADTTAPRQPAKVRLNPIHPRSTAKTTTRAAERARGRRDPAEIERLHVELQQLQDKQAGRASESTTKTSALPKQREGRAIRWGTIITALATIAAVVVAALAYSASKDGVRISEQQRTDVQTAFLGRIMLQPKYFAEPILEGGDLVVVNANTLAIELRLSVSAHDKTHNKEVLVKATIPGCSQITYRIPDEVDTWEGSTAFGQGASVYNPLDGRWWSVGLDPEFPAGPLSEETKQVLLDGLWQDMPGALAAAQTVKSLSGCV
ncbi:hypothetical protein [Nonomuraea soli]|uniref:Uncharacterized protein n=1 Tax=Nonomuraea soli TaxID=1032476 RepID=A0A7W0CSM3_9ACTN|nr:hypothetical protein [Nonomuraea soli]MBA2896420.1 hypothetical protein [Nonomuraea soli]